MDAFRDLKPSLSSDLYLELNAKEGEPYLRMAAHYGVISLKAAINLYQRAEKASHIKVEQDRTTQVKRHHRQQTEQNQQLQSARHLSVEAKTHLSQQAEGSLQIQTGAQRQLRVQQNYRIKTRSQHNLHLPKGSHITQVKGDITIQGKGQGDMILGNATAGICLSPDGYIKLYGKVINLKSSQITLSGTTDYDAAGSNQPETPPRPQSLVIPGINKLLPTTPPAKDPAPHDRMVKILGRDGNPVANQKYLFVHPATGEEKTGITDEHGLTDMLVSEIRSEKYAIYLIKDNQNA